MTAATPARQSTIVVIDDDEIAADGFERILKASGYAVLVAGDAETGIERIERGAPDAVLLDLLLPLTDGLEILRRLRRKPQHATLPVAILTGDYFVSDEAARELRALGARIYFKPVWFDDLLEIVRDLLGDPSDR
jgi:DNA-binding response OmpR family regulator